MTTKFRCQVSLERDGGLPEDASVNVWHFDADDPDGEANDLADRLIAFYQGCAGYLSSLLSGNATIKLYDMEDPEPRVPIYTDDFTISVTSGGDPLPAEMALCLSMRGAAESGVNMARRRGRIYLGPLMAGVGEINGADFRIKASVANDLVDLLQTLAVGPDPGDARLAVYSPTTDATSSLADAFNDVTYVWVDNAFDVQRRRGARATVRYSGDIS